VLEINFSNVNTLLGFETLRLTPMPKPQMTLPTMMCGMDMAEAWIAEPTITHMSPINMQPRLPRGMPTKKTKAEMTVAARTYDEATIGIS
jgi:hypothetical protein